MTLAVGRRVIVVEGVERWREADVEQQLAPADGRDAARDDARDVRPRGGSREGSGRAARGGRASRRSGRRADDGQAVGAAQVGARAGRRASGVVLDASAAKALVAQVGERQQRLLRELEKLALEGDADASAQPRARPARAGRERSRPRTSSARAAHSAEFRAFALADALVGADAREATLTYLAPARAGRAPVWADLPDRLAPARRARGLASACRPASSAAESSAACGCRRGRPTGLIADVARSDPARLRARARRARRPRARLPRRGRARRRPRPVRGDGRGHARAARDPPDHCLSHAL